MCFAADFSQNDLVLKPTTAGATASPDVMAAQISYATGIFADDRTLNGAAADVWSSGVVFYHMLTGEAPFKPLASASMTCDPNSRVQAYEDMLRGMQSWVSSRNLLMVRFASPFALGTHSTPCYLAFPYLLSCLHCCYTSSYS